MRQGLKTPAATLTTLAIALSLAACGGGSDSDDRTVATSPGPTGATGSGAGGARDRSRGSRTADSTGTVRRPDPRFGERVSFLEKSFFGARSQVVYFVASEGQPALDQAKACVRRNLAKAPSAYCFAFPSEKAFRYSRVARRPPAGMKRPCWSAYWGKPRDRRAIGSAANPAAAALKCPDAGL